MADSLSSAPDRENGTVVELGLVSVVIPTYNRAGLVPAAIRSVLAQTYEKFEIVVVDDGSTDETEAVIRREFGDDPRVRYFRKENGGVSSARNFGLRQNRGEFVAFLDSDDVWLPGKLELQVECLRRFPLAGMVWTDMDAIRTPVAGEEGVAAGKETVVPKYLRKMYGAYRYFPQATDLFVQSIMLAAGIGLCSEACAVYFGDIFSQMILGNLVHTSTVLMRRARQMEVGFFDERFRTGEDYKFHLMTCRAGPVAFADVSTIRYRIGEADALTSGSMHREIAANYLTTVEETLRENRNRIHLPREVFKASMADAHNWAGTAELEAGDRRAACRHFFGSLRFRPFQLTACKNLLKAVLPDWIIARIRAAR